MSMNDTDGLMCCSGLTSCKWLRYSSTKRRGSVFLAVKKSLHRVNKSKRPRM